MKKYLISGIKDSNSGVGRLLKNLTFYADKHGYNCLFKPRRMKNPRLLLFKKKEYLTLFKEILFRSTYFFRLLFFIIHIYSLKNTTVIIIHPQTLHYNLFFRLLKHNKVSIYVMDNSFFCIKSRNFRQSVGECMDCLGNLNNCHENCKPYPINYKRQQNLNYLNKYLNKAPSINFFAQNPSQGILLSKHFKKYKSIEIIGMNTGEIKQYEGDFTVNKKKFHPDIVYHGSTSSDKGIEYLLQLAQILKNVLFLIPDEQTLVENHLDTIIGNSNILFHKCTWETGLKEYVATAKLTICPSLWSAPIEGALIKSIALSPMTAVVKTQYGFVNDIPDGVVLKLNCNPKIASTQIIQYLEKRTDQMLNQNAQNYLNRLLHDTDLKMSTLFK